MGATINNNSDEKSKVSVNDDSTGYLAAKIVPGNGIDTAILNPGAVETLEIAVDETELAGTSIPFAFTTGSIPFSNGTTLIEDNPNLFWDNTNNRLGIGTNTPFVPLEVAGIADNFTDYLALNRFSMIRASRTETTSLAGSDSDGQMHLELKLNPSSSYAGLGTNTITSFLLTESGNAQNFTTLALRAGSLIVGHQGTGTVSTIQAVSSGARNTSTGTVTNFISAVFTNLNNGGGTVTTGETLRIGTPAGRTSGSPNSIWGTTYGLNIQDQNPTGASNTLSTAPIALKIQNQTASGAYGIQIGTGLNYLAGNTRVGSTSAPINALSVTGTTDVTTQVTTPIVSGGTTVSDTLTLKANDTAWPRVSRIQTDFLTIGANFTYPTGSAAAFNSIISSPAITGIDVANPNISTFIINPAWTNTVDQSWGLVVKAGLSFTPTLTSAVGAAGTDNIIFAAAHFQPSVNGTSGPRTYTNVWGISVDPRIAGSAGTVTAMNAVRTRGNTVAGTTVTTFNGYTQEFQLAASSTMGTYRGLIISPTLSGTITTFEGVRIAAQTAPSGNNIGFYQLGTAMHNRFQGDVMIGEDSTPTNPLHIIETGSGTTNYLIKLRNNAVANNTATGIKFTNSTNDAVDHASIVAIRSNSPNAESTDLTFATTLDGSNRNIERVRIDSAGRVGIGTTAPTAKLHIAAGTATASSAPLKLTSGTNLTAPEAGTVEYDGNRFYGTSLGTATRQEFITSMLKQITLVTTVSSTAETTQYTTTIPGGTLGTSRRIKLIILGDVRNASGFSEGITFRVNFAGTNIYTVTYTAGSSANYHTISGEFIIQARNSASIQDTHSRLAVSTAGTNILTGAANLVELDRVANYFGLTAASASDQTLEYTIQMSRSDANFATRLYSAIVEFI